MVELCDPAERQRCVADLADIRQTYTTARHVDSLLKLLEEARMR
jgi:hypothetical protein